MDTSTSAYRLMELTAISGECSPRVLAHLHLSTSYGEKLITRLKKEGYIRTHYKDGLRGYRLTSRGKKLLLGENPARFSFYLSGSSDTNRPRSDFPRRLRLQQASIAYAMLQSAGVEIYRDRKSPLFQPGTGQKTPYNMALPAFYHSREVKELGAETVKINNSRTTGILLAPECIYAVFCTGGALMKWEYRTELKVKALLSYHISRGILSSMDSGSHYHPDTPIKALIIGEGMDTALKLMESTGGFQKSYFYLDSSFDYFHYIPDDATGITMIRLLCSPALQKALRNLLLSDLQVPCPDYGLEHDAVSDGMPVLLAFDFDMLRLSRFRTALSFHGLTGSLICFDFQKPVLQQYFGNAVVINTIDLKNLKGGSYTETDRKQKETTDAAHYPARTASGSRICRRLCIPAHHQLPYLDFIRRDAGERHFAGISRQLTGCLPQSAHCIPLQPVRDRPVHRHLRATDIYGDADGLWQERHL